MDFKQFQQVLRRRWITIIVVVGIALGIGAAITFELMTPQYESKARIYVSTAGNGASNDTTAVYALAARIQSYADLATSSDVMQNIIDQLDLDLTTSQLADKISSEVVTNTTLIQLTVHDENAQRAQAISRLESESLRDYLTKLDSSDNSATDSPIVAKITDPASLNTSTVSPRVTLNLVVAGLIGLLLGIGLAFARDLLDRTVSSLEHVQEQTEKPVLASVLFDPGIKGRPLLTDLGGFAPRTEAFRLLRTNLQFLDLDEQPRSLVVSSAVPGEGKTMSAVNLGVALAQAGRRTLIIDGDLRRPRVAGLLGLDTAIGLTTALVGKIDLKDAIQVHEASGLHCLASGGRPPNPTEILQSRLTRDLFKTLRDSYDMVIIDAPPLLPVADASVLATIADGTILVVRHGKTTRDQLAEAITRLDQIGGRLSGVVVNMVPRRATNNYYYYYTEGERLSPPPDKG